MNNDIRNWYLPSWMKLMYSVFRNRSPDLLLASNSSFSDCDARHIEILSSLEIVDLGKTNITDRTLHVLSGLIQLKELYLHYTKVSTDGLRALGRLKHLTHLNLDGTEIDDSIVSLIIDFPCLTWFSVDDTRVSQNAVLELKKAKPNLVVRWLRAEERDVINRIRHFDPLWLTGADGHVIELAIVSDFITDMMISELRNLVSIEKLMLSGSSVCDDMIVPLASLPVISILDVRHCNLTNRAVATFAAMKTLKNLDVRNTGIDQSGVVQLKSELSNCCILSD